MTASTGQLKPGGGAAAAAAAGGEKKGDDYFVQTLGVVQLDSEEDIRLQVGAPGRACGRLDRACVCFRKPSLAQGVMIRDAVVPSGLMFNPASPLPLPSSCSCSPPPARPPQIKLLCEAMENVKRRVNQIAGSNHLNPIDFPTRNELNEVKKVIMADISDIDAKYVK